MSAPLPGKPMGDGLAQWLGGARAGGEPAKPRDAATVILLRPAPSDPRGAGGFEVFLVRRAQQIAFMGGAHVFPGGRVDRADASIEAAACREVREECGLSIGPESLLPWARWVTPEVEPKRFDARFFIARAPAGDACADGHETTEALWIAPAEALARCDRGEITLPPPTLWNLQDLARLGSIEAALEAARARDLSPVTPRVRVQADGALALLLPGDPLYERASEAGPEPAPGAQRRFILADGRWLVRR